MDEAAGTEPVKPELSGLRLPSTAGLPRRMTPLMISLAYRWEPSEEYVRRQGEMQTGTVLNSLKLQREV